MPAWKLDAYRGTPGPVLNSPLEQERIRVFSRKTGLPEQKLAQEFEEAIVAFAKHPEETARIDEIIEKYLCDYRELNTRN